MEGKGREGKRREEKGREAGKGRRTGGTQGRSTFITAVTVICNG